MRSLRASVVIVDPRVGVEYVTPVASLEAIYFVVATRVDTSGRYKFLQDATAVVDGTAFALTKPLSDVVAPPDAISVSALKVLADGIAMVDAETFDTLKALADTAPMLDDETIDVAKLLQDAPELLDLAAKVMSKSLADAFGFTDDETVSALKGLSDSVEMQDVIATLLLFIRNFDDAVSVGDDDSWVFTPATKVEQITVTDTDNIDYQKNIADGFAMNDGSEAVDGSTYSFSKGISNVAFVGDVRSLIFTTSRVESVSVADAGLLSVQDYCDLSYFAEDYVGLSQSF